MFKGYRKTSAQVSKATDLKAGRKASRSKFSCRKHKSKKAESGGRDKSYYCIFYNELFADLAPTETWIQCQVVKRGLTRGARVAAGLADIPVIFAHKLKQIVFQD
jgi:hypothetical protein